MKTKNVVALSFGAVVIIVVGSILAIVLSVVLVLVGREITTSDQPTRTATKGVIPVEMEKVWLDQPAIENYTFTSKNWGPRDTLGGKRYSVDYTLEVRLKSFYTYTDVSRFFDAVLDSVWNTKADAPEGTMTITIFAPGSASFDWEKMAEEKLGPKWNYDSFKSGKESKGIRIVTNTTVMQEALGDWAAGSAPDLEGLFKRISLDDPEQEIISVPGLAETPNVLLVEEKQVFSATEEKFRVCFKASLTYATNPQLNTFYRRDITVRFYDAGGNILKEIVIDRKDSDPDYLEQEYRTGECYDNETINLDGVTGIVSWEDSPGFKGGTSEARITRW